MRAFVSMPLAGLVKAVDVDKPHVRLLALPATKDQIVGIMRGGMK